MCNILMWQYRIKWPQIEIDYDSRKLSSNYRVVENILQSFSPNALQRLSVLGLYFVCNESVAHSPLAPYQQQLV